MCQKKTYHVVHTAFKGSIGAFVEKILQLRWLHARGLHLRPASQLARLIAATSSAVQFECREQIADGKSALDLLMLAVEPGEPIRIRIAGADSEQLAAQLRGVLSGLALPI